MSQQPERRHTYAHRWPCASSRTPWGPCRSSHRYCSPGLPRRRSSAMAVQSGGHGCALAAGERGRARARAHTGDDGRRLSGSSFFFGGGERRVLPISFGEKKEGGGRRTLCVWRKAHTFRVYNHLRWVPRGHCKRMGFLLQCAFTAAKAEEMCTPRSRQRKASTSSIRPEILSWVAGGRRSLAQKRTEDWWVKAQIDDCMRKVLVAWP